jgi:predicted DNA-binding transcriptional regulator YafY
VQAVHGNVASLQWGGGPTVDADALAVLALACRDREQVRFDYVRRDGDDSSRLVEPHQLVTAGRRWYLVAWDLRRDDWRTFRLDRLERARLAGGACALRELPGGDAAAFVAQSIRSMPAASSALLEVHGPADALAEMLHWHGAEIEPLGADRTSVRVSGGSDEHVVRVVTWLAASYRVVVREPDAVAARVAELAARLTPAP